MFGKVGIMLGTKLYKEDGMNNFGEHMWNTQYAQTTPQQKIDPQWARKNIPGPLSTENEKA